MIGTEGQYVFNFELAGKSNFIHENDLLNFTYNASAGGSLPIFSLSFNVTRTDVFKLLNEGNSFNISYGKNSNDLTTAKVRQFGEPQIEKNGNNSYSVYINGFYDTPNYLSTKSGISNKKSAAEVLIEKAKLLNFKMGKNNIERSADSQYWIQMSCSDRRFFTDLLMHADVQNSFPALAITHDGEFRLIDFIKEAKKEPKWRFTQSPQKASDIPYDGDPEYLTENSELINLWLGYLSDKPVYDINEGIYTKYTEDIKNVLAISSKLPRLIEEEKRTEELNFINEYVHKNYWKSYQKNLKHSIMMSRSRIGLSFQGIYKEINPLDFCVYEDLDIVQEGISEKHLSGKYVVTVVNISIENKKIITYCELNRESLSFITGNIK